MIVLVTGASSSGKSSIAENIAINMSSDEHYYIATMHNYDEESEKRIARHRSMRKEKNFTTIEKYTDISSINISHNSTCLLECMSNLLANEMYDKNGSHENAVEKIVSDIQFLANKCENIVIVSNEVFSDGSDYDEFCSDYVKKLGMINQKIASMSDKVYESVVGIPLMIKG